MDYAFNDGFINIRAVMKKNNVYEIENDVAQFNVNFFKYHFDNLKILRSYYSYILDFLQLSNFLEIFDFVLEQGDPPQIL
jgi:hypothetical protein